MKVADIAESIALLVLEMGVPPGVYLQVFFSKGFRNSLQRKHKRSTNKSKSKNHERLQQFATVVLTMWLNFALLLLIKVG